ncbi:MAG: 6-bladed beta-propeller [Bacteroidales bacterium]|nr:6-bladed beta-propeller [Bacteroidales bacterium]
MKHSICFIVGSGILLSGLAGCSKATVTDSDIYVDPVPTPSVQVSPVASIPSLNLDQSDDTCFLDKEVANMRLIPLETTDDCLIGRISDLFIVDDTIVVIDGEKSKQIYLYGLDGKLINKFGKVGAGPGEYLTITHATPDSNGISILDCFTGRQNSYDFSGKLINSTAYTITSPSFILQQNDSTLVATFASYHKSSPFAVAWLEGDSIVDTALPYKIKRDEIAPSLFRLSSTEIGLFIPTIDTIYSISGRQIVPKYKLGLISDDEAEEWRRMSTRMDVIEKNKYRMSGAKMPADFIEVYPLDDYFVISHQKVRTRYISVVDRNTLQSRNYWQSCGAPLQLFVPPYIQSASGNTLCGYIAEDYFMRVPDESRERIERHFSEHDQEILKNYDYENNNPIVWLMELK